MNLSKKKALLISFIVCCSILLSVLFCCLFNDNSKNKITDVQSSNSYEDLDIVDFNTDKNRKTGVYTVGLIMPKGTVVTNPLDFEFVIPRLMLRSVASGKTAFTISSAEEFKYYVDAVNYKVETIEDVILLPSMNGPRTRFVYKTEYPINFALNVKIEKEAWYMLNFVGGVHYADCTVIYADYAYFAEDHDYTATPYRCELKLTNDITVTRSDFDRFREFAGIFNGNGHSITFTGDDRTTMATKGADGCVFKKVLSGAVVKNTKFVNLKAYLSDSGTEFDNSTFAGGIAGLNEGTIENCIVENCEFLSNKYRTYAHCAPIAGKNVGTVQNCLLLGEYKLGADGENLLFTNPDGLTSFYFVVLTNIHNSDEVSKNKAINCVYRMTTSKFWNDKDCEKHIRLPNDPIDEDDPTKGTRDSMENHTGCYLSTDGNFSNLTSKSAEGGWYLDKPWYYCSEYDAWPMLRIFMSWKNIEFEVEANGKVKTQWDSSYSTSTSIYLPESASCQNSYGAIKENVIYGQKITAQPDENCSVVSWTLKDRVYTIRFTAVTHTIQFFNNDPNVEVVSDKVELGAKYTLKQSDKIFVTIVEFGKETQLVEGVSLKCVRSITYSFIDINNETRSITYRLKDNKYFIGYKSSWVNGENEITESHEIDHSAYLKSYDVKFN